MRSTIFGTVVLILCVTKTLESDEKEELEEKLRKIGDVSGQGEPVVTSDIITTKPDTGRHRRQAFRNPNAKWKNGVVEYTFAPNTPENVKNIFKKATEVWSKTTCLDIRENANAKAKIVVARGPGCMSSLGMQGNAQGLMLGDKCLTVGSAAHELGHALGLFHMQSRHDRDNYLLLNKDNINPDNFGDFSKETPERNENYNLPYDYGSIMHYHAWGFAKDISKPTMVPKDEKYIRTLGSRVLSFYDKLLMNTHYGCLDKCDNNTAAKCTNGGFPHPKNCSECICPGGYGGALCDQRPKGCGKVVRVTSTSPRKLNLFVGELREGEVSRECTYWLEAPAGSKVEVKLISLSNWGIVGGCHIGGIEFKTQADQKATGYRFCTKSDIGTTLLSSSNRVPVMAYNHESVFEATIEYKVVKPR